MLAVCRQTHDVVPAKAVQLRQMVAVKAGVVGEDGPDVLLLQPAAQLLHGLLPGAEPGRHRRFQKEDAVVHSAHLTFRRKHMVAGGQGAEGVPVGQNSSDGHDPVLPVGFGINDGDE